MKLLFHCVYSFGNEYGLLFKIAMIPLLMSNKGAPPVLLMSTIKLLLDGNRMNKEVNPLISPL